MQQCFKYTVSQNIKKKLSCVFFFTHEKKDHKKHISTYLCCRVLWNETTSIVVSNWYNWTQYTLDDVNKMLKKDQNNNETNNDLVAKSEYCELWQLASIYDVGNVWNFAFWKHFCLDDLRTQLIPLQNRVNETILEECIQKMNHRYKYNYLYTWGPLIYFIHLFWITHPTNYYSWVRYPKENMSYLVFF